MKSLKIKKAICHAVIFIMCVIIIILAVSSISIVRKMRNSDDFYYSLQNYTESAVYQMVSCEEYIYVKENYEAYNSSALSFDELEEMYQSYGYDIIDEYHSISAFIDDYNAYDASYWSNSSYNEYAETETVIVGSGDEETDYDDEVAWYEDYDDEVVEYEDYDYEDIEDVIDFEVYDSNGNVDMEATANAVLYYVQLVISRNSSIYVSEESQESLRTIYSECTSYEEALKTIADYYDNKDSAYPDDPNFYYIIEVTTEDSDGEKVKRSYGNEDYVLDSYGLYISFSAVKSAGIYDESYDGFSKSNSGYSYAESIIETTGEAIENLCKSCDIKVDVEFAVDTDFTVMAGTLWYTRNNVLTAVETEAYERESLAEIGGIVVCIIVIIIMVIFLTRMAGHREKGDEVKTVSFDKLWLDLTSLGILAAFLIVITVTAYLLDLFSDSYASTDVFLSNMFGTIWLPAFIIGAECIIILEIFLALYLSFVRRIKTKTLVESTLAGMTCRKIKRLILRTGVFLRKLIKNLIKNSKATKTALILAVAFYAVNFILILLFFISVWNYSEIVSLITFIILVAVNLAAVILVWKYMAEFDKLDVAAKRIVGGDIDYKIDKKFLYPANIRLAENINNIRGGLNKAVEESIKNERMKTDLITNVSHDLKTPLTSIINYVKLLKEENIEDEKIRKYVDILDMKAERLKILTDDLVEASKLSSGTIELTKTDIDLAELINQATGEFEERLKKKKLSVVLTIKEQPLVVNCDANKIWRMLDNLLNNVCKYALEGTRVYIDVGMDKDVYICIKNISENPLCVDPAELTERFVRGDESRNTEGSGLGLSIARSIVERHGGRFEIVLDGDLFKVTVNLPVSS